MSKEVSEEQIAQLLLDVNRLISLGTNHAERAQKYPLTPLGVWSGETRQKWEVEFPRLLAMATAGNFSKVLDALHEGLGLYRDDPR